MMCFISSNIYDSFFFRSDILLVEFDFLHHPDALPRGFRGGFLGVGRGEPSLNPHWTLIEPRTNDGQIIQGIKKKERTLMTVFNIISPLFFFTSG